MDNKHKFLNRLIYLGTFIFCIAGCSQVQTPPQTHTPFPTKPHTPSPSPTSAITRTVTPTPFYTRTPPYTVNPFPIVEASECNWEDPSELTPFRFSGPLLMAEFIPGSWHDEPTKYKLWKITSDVDHEQYVGSYELHPSISGPPNHLSPNSQWMMTVSTWNPLDEPPTPIQITSIDGSQSFLIERDLAWDITLGWYDNERIIILPSNGKITDILLLNVFTLVVEPHPNVQNAINRSFRRGDWSPWRERWGKIVFFNHQVSHLLYFDFGEVGELSSIAEQIPLWSFDAGRTYRSFGRYATWSPDDNFVAFSVRFSDRFRQVDELFIVNNKGEANQYTDFSEFLKSSLSIQIFPNASWSPDSSKLALRTLTFSSDDKTIDNIYILDLERQEIQDMCTNGLPIAFSPDGRYLLYTPGVGYVDVPDPYYILDSWTGRKWLINESKLRNVIGWLPDP